MQRAAAMPSTSKRAKTSKSDERSASEDDSESDDGSSSGASEPEDESYMPIPPDDPWWEQPKGKALQRCPTQLTHG